MMLTDLADACRTSGLQVVEVKGWQTRGHGQMADVQTVVCHHTATSAKAAGDYPSLGIVRDGRPDLPGPLAQLGLGRDGTVYVIAAGLAYHAGATFDRAQSNAYAIGIEAEHDGVSPWRPGQRTAYARLCAALCRHYDLDADRVQGHKEVAAPKGRKPDPTFDMTEFRRAVADLMQEDDMAQYADQLDTITTKLDKVLGKLDGSRKREVATNALLRKIKQQGAAKPEDVAAIDALLDEG